MIKYLTILLFSTLLSVNINDTGSSGLVVFDVVNPTVEITYPEGGESFESLTYFTPFCNAYDNYLSETPITIYLSESSGSPYQLLASNQIYNDSLFIQLPDIYKGSPKSNPLMINS